jgi:shikimate kinase
MKNIVLCGFMGCGKSTVGAALALLLGYKFIDMDAYIESLTGKSVSQIFGQCGEEHFRALESQAATGLSRESGLVISAGGGALLRAENAASFKAGGLVVFIDVPLAVIRRRLEGDLTRPLLLKPDKDKVMEELYETRRPYYCSAADLIVENSDNIPAQAMAERIAGKIAAFDPDAFLTAPAG